MPSSHTEVAEFTCFWSHRQFLDNLFSNNLFLCLITAFHCGLKNVVRVLSIWRYSMRLRKSSDSKFSPGSVWMLMRTPKWLIQCSSSAVAVISAVCFGIGTASYSFVKWLPKNAIFELPFETGSALRKSLPMWAKRKLGSQLTKLCLWFCLGLLRSWQTRQLETNTRTFFVWPGQ